MKITGKPSVYFSLMIAVFSAILLRGFFAERHVAQTAKVAALEDRVRRSASLLAHQSEIDANYGRLSATEGEAMSAWIARLSEDARQSGFALDGLSPKDSRSVSLRFRSDMEALAQFISTIASKDPLSRIDEIRIVKTQKGVLDCELSVSKVAP